MEKNDLKSFVLITKSEYIYSKKIFTYFFKNTIKEYSYHIQDWLDKNGNEIDMLEDRFLHAMEDLIIHEEIPNNINPFTKDSIDNNLKTYVLVTKSDLAYYVYFTYFFKHHKKPSKKEIILWLKENYSKPISNECSTNPTLKDKIFTVQEIPTEIPLFKLNEYSYGK